MQAVLSRREFLKRLSLASAGAVGGSSVLLRGCDGNSLETDELDALQTKVLSELGRFTDWLEREGVPGYIGESRDWSSQSAGLLRAVGVYGEDFTWPGFGSIIEGYPTAFTEKPASADPVAMTSKQSGGHARRADNANILR